MNKLLIIFCCACLCGCAGHPDKSTGAIWNETADRDIKKITSGIPAYQKTEIIYKREGRMILTANFGDPALVSVATQPLKWGYFQFPNIYRKTDGMLVASWHMATDAIDSYGKGGIEYAQSDDKGKIWESTGNPGIFGGLLLPNGDGIKVYTPKALKTDSLKLPEPIDSAKENYGSSYLFYRVKDLPPALRGVYLERLEKGSATWNIEKDSLEDPTAVRNSESGLFAVVWWGDMHLAQDGSLIAGTYPGFRSEQDGRVKASGISFYRSTDQGHVWKIQGHIPYVPDIEVDSNGNKRFALGFTEPTFEILADGGLLCVMRTTDGLGNGPMYWSRSQDLGVTWSKPIPFTPNGVLPRLLRLENGVLVMASGRPGVQLRFCTDGKGELWTDPFELLPFDKAEDVVSCGYTKLLATGKDRFLIIYSDFKYQTPSDGLRKAIKIQEINVSPG